MIKFSDTFKYLIPLWIITIITLIITFAHHGSLIIDCGREAYYPQEILNGKVLYKDLFNIYGPFAYIFNAILYKIFGINLNTLYFAGSLCALGIITTIFFIARKFLFESFAFSISVFAISIGVIHVRHFNYVFPYSFGITYGLLSVLISLLCLIYYSEKKDDYLLLLSFLFCGIAVANKYEFLMYLPVILFVMFKLKASFNALFLGILALLLIPEMCFAFLFVKGLSLQDLVNTANIINSMIHTQTLKYFYINSGIFFSKKTPLFLVLSLFYVVVPFFVYMVPVIFKKNSQNFNVNLMFTFSGIFLMILFKNHTIFSIFGFLPVLLTLLAVINFKYIIKNLPQFVLVTSSILISLKVFWASLLGSYGIYFIPLLIISIFTIYKDKFSKKDLEYIGFYILILGILIGFNNLKLINDKKFEINTSKGRIFLEEKDYNSSKILMNFVAKNTSVTDKILIYPEGMMINFLTNRKTDDFYNTYLPLYEETFGNEIVINHFKKNMPEYIIFNNWDTSDYYFSIICKDYGIEFCKFVQNEYFLKGTISGDLGYTIFKKK